MENQQEALVKIENFGKRYAGQTAYAVDGVSFCCYAGEIVGLLGHNGAGKSTILKCLEGMLPFDHGTITIGGHDIRVEPTAAKLQMGFVTDNQGVFTKMTGVQYLDFMADVYKVPVEVRKERLEELQKVFALGDAVYNLISSYSHGMRQKICMMGSLIHMPKLWIMDEPMMGLDPYTMHAVQTYMREYVGKGNTILFSSHMLNTVTRICDRVILIRGGKQISELDVRRMMEEDPQFDFETYFLESVEKKYREGDA